MGQHRFTHGCVKTVVPEGMLVGDSPQFAGDELPISGKEARATGILIHIECFPIRVRWAGGDVVQLKVGERRNPNNASNRLESRGWQIVSREVDRNTLSIAWL